nr:MAG TPA: hypothetical protein [Caudoviricetes sp.]
MSVQHLVECHEMQSVHVGATDSHRTSLPLQGHNLFFLKYKMQMTQCYPSL